MRTWLFILSLLVPCLPAQADVTLFPAPSGQDARQMVVYSTLDTRLASPLISAFQATMPDVAVRYEDFLATEIATRVMQETDSGQPSADFVFSSAMDLQIKLANDGYALPVQVPQAARWPRWANWRDTAYALTLEPGVLVYHKPSFPDGPPVSRLDLIDWLNRAPPDLRGRIGTYDITRSAVGYLYLARDVEHFADIWSLLRTMARAGLQTFATSQEIIDRVADGRLVLGYNILGSYAADQALQHPDLGLVLLRDFTVVISRVALVPRAAPAPDLGAAFLGFLMGAEGQSLLADKLRLPAVSLGVQSIGTDSGRLRVGLGDPLRPVAVSPGLLVYLDQEKRRKLVRKWEQALSAD